MTVISSTEKCEVYDQDKFKATITFYAEPNPAELEKQIKFNPLLDRVSSEPIETKGNLETHVVDGCLKVTGPSAAWRQVQINLWSTARQFAASYKTFGLLGTLGGLVVIAIPLVIGKDQTKLSTLSVYTIAAGAIVAIGSAFAMAYFGVEEGKAESQIEEWKRSPAMEVAQRRKDVYANRDFIRVYREDLKLGAGDFKRGILLPVEVQQLYKSYGDQYFTRLRDNSKFKTAKDWVNAFTINNPLDAKLMEYGLGSLPAEFQPVCEDFVRFSGFIQSIHGSYEKIKQDAQKAAQSRIERINEERNSKLKPFQERRDKHLREAQIVRDDELRLHPLDTDDVRKYALKEYDRRTKDIEALYQMSAAPINEKYDLEVKIVKNERDAQLAIHEEQKSNQVGNQFNAGRDLLEKAYAVWKGEQQQYQRVNYQQYNPYLPPQPVYLPPAPYPVHLRPQQQGYYPSYPRAV